LICFLIVEGKGIIDHRRNAFCFKKSLELIPLPTAHFEGILVKYVGGVGHSVRCSDAINIGEVVIVKGSGSIPGFRVGVQVRQLNIQDGRLKGVQPGVDPYILMGILFYLAMVGDHLHLFEKPGIIRENGPAIAITAKVLGWEK
jgi:hypothetical protein